MEFQIHSHRFGYEIFQEVEELGKLWSELEEALVSITDDELMQHFLDHHFGSSMSISMTINALIKERLIKSGWNEESALFAEEIYRKKGGRWRLDFSKATRIPDLTLGVPGATQESGVAVEVAFNHGEAIAWNLLKPVIASELNHVPQETRIGAGVGVIICATKALKEAGGFDGAVGEYEKILEYLRPLRNFLTVPMVIVGLDAPKTFHIETKRKNGSSKGTIELGPLGR